MIWIVIIIILLSLMAWILFGPVIIYLATDNKSYRISLPGIFNASIVPAEGLFHIRGWILFIPYRFNPITVGKGRFGKKAGRTGEKPGRFPGKKGLDLGFLNSRLVPDILRSFRIRKLYLDLDTDDFILNAWLVPVFSHVNSGNVRLRTNFEGRSSLVLDLRTRMGLLLWAGIRNKYRSFF
jgi:hypothetical protein